MSEAMRSEVRALKWQVRALSVFLIAIMIAFGAMGFRGDGVGRFESVETQEFVLKDDAGNDRLKISVQSDGSVLQEFLSPDQKQQLILRAQPDGLVRFRSFILKGTPGFSLTSNLTQHGTNEVSGLSFYDENGVMRSTIQYSVGEHSDDRSALFALIDSEGKSRIDLRHMSKDDESRLRFLRPEGEAIKRRLSILDKSNAVYMQLRHDEQALAFELDDGLTRMGTIRGKYYRSLIFDNLTENVGGLTIQDEDHKPFLEASVNRGSNFQFSVRQTTGEQMWDIFGKLGTVASAAAIAGLTGDNTPPTCTGRGRYLQYDGGWRCASD